MCVSKVLNRKVIWKEEKEKREGMEGERVSAIPCSRRSRLSSCQTVRMVWPLVKLVCVNIRGLSGAKTEGPNPDSRRAESGDGGSWPWRCSECPPHQLGGSEERCMLPQRHTVLRL